MIMVRTRKKTWEQKVELVRDSFGRAKNDVTFAHSFYQNLFFLKPKIKDYFKETDFEHQEKAILFGMSYLMGFLEGHETNSRTQVLRIAHSHNAHNMAIHPHDYHYWIEALVMTSKDSDPLWHDDLAHYYRECLFFPISFMISQYYRED